MLYDNLKKMFEDIKEFTRNNPSAKIIQKDDPLKLRVGFKEEGGNNLWQAKITAVKSADRDDLFCKKYLEELSKPYKVEFLKFLNNKE